MLRKAVFLIFSLSNLVPTAQSTNFSYSAHVTIQVCHSEFSLERGNQAEQNNIQPGWTVSLSSLSGNQAFYSLVHDDPSGEIIIVNAQFYPKSCTGWSFL